VVSDRKNAWRLSSEKRVGANGGDGSRGDTCYEADAGRDAQGAVLTSGRDVIGNRIYYSLGRGRPEGVAELS